MTQRLLALATAVLLVVAGGLVLGGFDGGRAGDDLPDGPAPAGAPPRPLEKEVAEIQAFVAAERGLDFTQDVEVTLLEDGAFQDRLLADAEEDRGDLRTTARLLRAVGLLEGDVDLYEVVLGFYGDAVVGFYDAETDELVVRGGRLTPYRRSTLAHELTHALDDQHFDLHRPELDEGPADERSLAFSALVEGDAVRVEQAYRESLPRAQQLQLTLEEQRASGDIDLEGVPPVLPRIIGYPYVRGPGFVRAVLDAGGQARLDAAFADPPTTSEQIEHPAGWLAGRPVRRVPLPPAEGPVLEEGVYGMSSLSLTLEPVIGTADAQAAAEGWGGDAYVVWDAGRGRTCVRADVGMDSGAELTELARHLRTWADDLGATVERRADLVRFTACG